jgi:hypothetical protein
MNTTTITRTETIKKTGTMEVLWGAWAKNVRFNEQQRSTDIEGIYEQIFKDKRSDFPFIVDLLAVLHFEASIAEQDRTYQVALEIIDLDATTRILTDTEEIVVPKGDSPLRWYETFEIKNVEIQEPGYYELSILIDRQFKQRIPLWVLAPKRLTYDPISDSTTKSWSQQ